MGSSASKESTPPPPPQPSSRKASKDTQTPPLRPANLSDPSLLDSLSTGQGGESTDSSVRYAAYAARLKTVLLAAHRYVAYTSDIGESFRPVAHPWAVRGAYGISWAYIAGDVGWEGWKAYLRQNEAELETGGREVEKAERRGKSSGEGSRAERKTPAIEDWRAVMAQRAVFQSVASMGLPAFTIHSLVRYSGRAMKDVKNVRVRTWGPIGLGLAVVPALPYLFDQPVEHATEWLFHTAFRAVGGPTAVGEAADGKALVAGKKEKEL